MGLHVDPTAHGEQSRIRLRKAHFTQAQVDVLAEEFGNIRADLSKLEKRFDEHEKRFDSVDDQLGEVISALVRIEDHLFGRTNE